MLHYATIDAATLELLRSLMEIPGLDRLRLVDGTALALQLSYLLTST